MFSLPAKRTSQTPAPVRAPRHTDLDSLRGLAMLAVVISAAYLYRGQPYGGTWLGRVLAGLAGVYGWFFVLSAFLLYAPLVRQGLTGSGAVTPRGFLIRRLLRVVPLYWIAVSVVWAYNTSNLPGDWRDLAEHLTFTQVFDGKRIFYLIGPAWFVAVEVMFYLFIAASLTVTLRYCRLAEARKSRLLAITAPALVLILASWGFKAWELFVAHVPANHWSTWFGPLAWADDLGFGMFVAIAWVAADGRLLRPRVLAGTRVSAGVLFVAAMAVRGQSAASVAMFRELCMFSFLALLVSSVFAPPDARWRRALSRPFLARIGVVSYSLFIWYGPILLALSDHGLISSARTSFWVIAPLLLAFSVPAAFVSYWVIEYPAGHLRSLFAPGGGLRDYYADDAVPLMTESSAMAAPLMHQLTELDLRYRPRDPIPGQPSGRVQQSPVTVSHRPGDRRAHPRRDRVLGLSAVFLILVAVSATVTWREVGGQSPARGGGLAVTPARLGHGRSAASATGNTAGPDQAAAEWVSQQVSRNVIVACDPQMCAVLEARGVPAASLLVLGSTATNLLAATVVVETPALRNQFGHRLESVYAPTVLASFGSGSGQLTVRVVAPDGAAAYLDALHQDVAARAAAGTQLLANSRIAVAGRARTQLAAGQVDSRLLILLPVMAATHPIHILSFGDRGPGASRGIPLCSADLSGSSRTAGMTDADYLSWLVAFARAQLVPFAGSITVVRQGAQPVVQVQFSRPSPLDLLTSS